MLKTHSAASANTALQTTSAGHVTWLEELAAATSRPDAVRVMRPRDPSGRATEKLCLTSTWNSGQPLVKQKRKGGLLLEPQGHVRGLCAPTGSCARQHPPRLARRGPLCDPYGSRSDEDAAEALANVPGTRLAGVHRRGRAYGSAVWSRFRAKRGGKGRELRGRCVLGFQGTRIGVSPPGI